MTGLETPTTCPHCGAVHRAYTAMNDDDDSNPQPEPGNIAVCWSCVEFSEYGPDLQLQIIEGERYDQILRDNPTLQASLLTVWGMRRTAHAKQAQRAQFN